MNSFCILRSLLLLSMQLLLSHQAHLQHPQLHQIRNRNYISKKHFELLAQTSITGSSLSPYVLSPFLVNLQFSVYLGFFNAFSTLLQQIMSPYGYSDNDAGIAGAVLIITGLVVAAIISPIVDRYHIFIPVARILVVIVSICYLVLIWVIRQNAYAAICVICALLGAVSFSLLPLALELSVELTHPVPPEVSASIYWIGGQFLGGIFIIIMNALRDDNGTPPDNMTKALIFEGVVACITVPSFFFIKSKQGRLAQDVQARYK
jgi:hypothetical protein